MMLNTPLAAGGELVTYVDAQTARVGLRQIALHDSGGKVERAADVSVAVDALTPGQETTFDRFLFGLDYLPEKHTVTMAGNESKQSRAVVSRSFVIEVVGATPTAGKWHPVRRRVSYRIDRMHRMKDERQIETAVWPILSLVLPHLSILYILCILLNGWFLTG
jgi:hypothetical protein